MRRLKAVKDKIGIVIKPIQLIKTVAQDTPSKHGDALSGTMP